MANTQSSMRGKRGNASGRRVKEPTGGVRHPAGWSDGKAAQARVATRANASGASVP